MHLGGACRIMSGGGSDSRFYSDHRLPSEPVVEAGLAPIKMLVSADMMPRQSPRGGDRARGVCRFTDILVDPRRCGR